MNNSRLKYAIEMVTVVFCILNFMGLYVALLVAFGTR